MSRRFIFVIALFATMVLALAACDGASSGSTPLNVTLTATEFKYDPNTINASPGQTINLTVKNTGSVQHTWVLSTSNIKLTIDPGKTVTQSFTAPTTVGTYQFECDLAGHKEAGMIGQLIVK
jgi:plastocyanin